MRCIVGIVVLIAAAALVARAMIKSKGISASKSSSGYATLAVARQTSVSESPNTPSNTVAIKEINALSELNELAKDMAGAFVYLPGNAETTARVPAALIVRVAKMVEPQGGAKIGLFLLKTGSPDYQQAALQMTFPGVLAMVKGGGMAPVSGEITETKLVQAFVAASSAGGCGPGGCGPEGCK